MKQRPERHAPIPVKDRSGHPPIQVKDRLRSPPIGTKDRLFSLSHLGRELVIGRVQSRNQTGPGDPEAWVPDLDLP